MNSRKKVFSLYVSSSAFTYTYVHQFLEKSIGASKSAKYLNSLTIFTKFSFYKFSRKMVRFLLETDEDQEMITILTNYRKGDMQTIEKIMESVDFQNKEKVDNFFDNVNSACSICTLQSLYIPEIVVFIYENLHGKEQILLKESLFKQLEININDGTDRKLQFSTFAALCVRQKLIEPKRILQSFNECLDSETCKNKYRNELYILQMLFYCGDVLYDAETEATKAIVKRLKHRGIAANILFANEFWISRTINSADTPSCCDYDCLIHDDVDYLQKLAASPNFDINRCYEASLWENDPIISPDTKLIQAAAFYGAEKCFRYLSLTGADTTSTSDANANRTSMFRGKVSILGVKKNNMKIYAKNKNPLLNNVLEVFKQRIIGYSLFIECKHDINDYAIAGNNFDILNFHNREMESFGGSPMSIAAGYNRIQFFNYLKGIGMLEKPKSIFVHVLENDNSCFLRYAMKYNIIDVADAACKDFFWYGRKCFTEVAHFYRNSPRFNEILTRSCIYIRECGNNPDKQKLVDIAYRNTISLNFLKLSIFADIDIARMILNKRIIDDYSLFKSPSDITLLSLDFIKELTKYEEIIKKLESQGINLLFCAISADMFDAVSYLIDLDIYKTRFTGDQMLTNASSIEMRNLIKSKMNE